MERALASSMPAGGKHGICLVFTLLMYVCTYVFVGAPRTSSSTSTSRYRVADDGELSSMRHDLSWSCLVLLGVAWVKDGEGFTEGSRQG